MFMWLFVIMLSGAGPWQRQQGHDQLPGVETETQRQAVKSFILASLSAAF